jgi:hypothetical protein
MATAAAEPEEKEARIIGRTVGSSNSSSNKEVANR